MKFLATTLRKLANRIDAPVARKRSYEGAARTNALAHWITSQTSGDAELRSNFRVLLDRCRELERNNAHMQAFLRACEMNIAGPDGITLQSSVTEPRKDKSGVIREMPDDLANNRIEQAFSKWCKPRFCSLNQRLSYAAFLRLLVRTVARDGNCLVRKISGPNARNDFNFALQILEVDHLDLDLFENKPNGNVVKFGIEFDRDGRTVSYTIFPVHPGDSAAISTRANTQRIVVPASEMTLVMMPRRPSQVIGEPWVVSAMTALKMLGKLEEYELIATMVASCKMGFFVNTGDGAANVGLGTEGANGTIVADAVAGAFEQLPEGWDFKAFDPSHPNSTIGEFVKLITREIAVGVGVAAVTLTGDLSDATYSSMRAGLGEERRAWMMLQTWIIETFLEQTYEEWLKMAMLSGQINLPFAKFEKFNKPTFHPCRWPSVNPVEDAAALSSMITMGVMSRTQYAKENGRDFQTTIQELGAEMAMAEELSVPIIEKDPYQNVKAALDNQQKQATGGK